MNYVIVDLEATCWDQRNQNRQEIIEIGAVLIDDAKNIVSEFERFVKPITHPKLSPFCTELTSITQEDVDQADYFPEVVADFKQWFNEESKEYVLCSWGFYDRKQFELDCELHGLDTLWLAQHISLKHQHGKIKGLRRNLGMKRALAEEGLKLDGTHHRGIDDARNIAKIFLKNFDHWNISEVKK
ncbi:MAG: exonuclease domain-containing protein [Bacteroidia bacterium]|nr:exonuclease domain-containing protein [Bacteroidia bacterium]